MSGKPCTGIAEKAEFDDATVTAGMARNTRFVGWGCAFFDFDNDGWKDLLLVNGHAFPEVEQKRIDIHFKDRRILYRNLGGGKFEDISERSGPAIVAPHSSRGLAVGDIDNDGLLEAIVNNQGEPPSLLKQSCQTAGSTGCASSWKERARTAAPSAPACG